MRKEDGKDYRKKKIFGIKLRKGEKRK